MRWLIILSAFLLSSCWVGEKLYSATTAVAGIPPGKYYDELAERSKIGRVLIEPNGMTKLVPDDGTEASIFGFAPLDGEGTKYAMWVSEEVDGKLIEDAGLYGLLIRSDGKYSFYMPQCSDTSAIALAAGARFEKGMTEICRFPDRVSLEKALRKWQPKPDEAMARFTRIGD